MVKPLDHPWLKITAVVLGLLLWFHVATEKIYNYELSLPLEEIALDRDLALSRPPPDSLVVIVSATGKQLLRQKWRDRGLKIIASQYTQGRHQLKLTTSNTFLVFPSSEVSLDEIISPTAISLHVDRRSQAQVAVLPDVTAEPDEGFTISEMLPTVPAEVTISGPHSIVRRITEVSTQRRELQGLRNNLTLTLPLAVPDSFGISLDPDSVTITLRVVPVKTRVFNDVPIVVYNIPPGRTVVAQPASIRIELTGPPTEIDLLNKNALIASADYTRMNRAGWAHLKIDCPSRFRVRNASSDSVAILIQ